MNYYAEWWENARNSTGIITKQTYLKQLEKELAQLKANPDYQHLATELTKWKAKYEKVRKELKDSDEITDKLAEENQAKDRTISDLQQQIQELENKYSEIKGLVEKRLAEQKQDYEKQLNNATHNQASILKTSLFKETENKELRQKTKQLKDEITILNSSETDQQRELKERGKLIIKLEEKLKENENNLLVTEQNLTKVKSEVELKEKDKQKQVKEVKEIQKELEFSESQLAFTNSKVKQLNPLFNQVLSAIKKNVILREKSKLKEAVANIQELMEWEKSPLMTKTSTTSPTEPIKTAEQLALEEKLEEKLKTAQLKITELEQTIKDLKDKDQAIAELEAKIKAKEETIKDLKKTKEPVPTGETIKPFTDKEQKWRNINLNFTESLITKWEKQGFSYEKTSDWIGAGLNITEAEYAWWLVNKAGIDYWKFLNETNPTEQTDLKKQFEEYKQTK